MFVIEKVSEKRKIWMKYQGLGPWDAVWTTDIEKASTYETAELAVAVCEGYNSEVSTVDKATVVKLPAVEKSNGFGHECEKAPENMMALPDGGVLIYDKIQYLESEIFQLQKELAKEKLTLRTALDILAAELTRHTLIRIPPLQTSDEFEECKRVHERQIIKAAIEKARESATI